MKRYLALIFIFSCLVLSVNADLTEDALVAVGGLGAADVYIAYLAIGSIADAYEEKVYLADEVNSLADGIATFCENSKSLLQQLLKSADKSDRKAIQDIIDAYSLLIKQAKALIAYSQDNDPDTANEFEDYRQKAWTNISELLDLENG